MRVGVIERVIYGGPSWWSNFQTVIVWLLPRQYCRGGPCAIRQRQDGAPLSCPDHAAPPQLVNHLNLYENYKLCFNYFLPNRKLFTFKSKCPCSLRNRLLSRSPSSFILLSPITSFYCHLGGTGFLKS